MWPPLGLAYIGAVLEEAGMKVKLLDAAALRMPIEETVKKTIKASPDYIIVNTATITFSSDMEVAKAAKKALGGIKIIVLGTHVTALPKETLEEGTADYIVLGEPDFVLRDLILTLEKGKSPKKIRGIGYRDGKKSVVTGIAPPIENLDELPFPARHLYPKDADYFNPLAKRLPYTTALSSRGCPFNCVYCTSIILYGHRFRARSPENVVQEIERCIDGGYKELFYRDETFTFDKKRVQEITKLIKERGLDITWMANSRVNTIDLKTAKAMKESGCHMLKFGVESGNQKILNNLRKGIKLEQTREAFKICKETGISAVAHMMFGSPGETEETVQDSINLIKEIKPDYASFNITTAYPGTPLWEMIGDKVGVKNASSYDIETTLEKTSFNQYWCELSQSELDRLYNKAYNEFYFRPSYILGRLAKQRSLKDVVRLVTAGAYITGFTIKNKFKK